MIRRFLLLASLAVPAFGQLQLFEFNGTTETPVGSLYQLPDSAPNDQVSTRFRIHNTGTGPVTLQILTLAGQSFSISATPSLPYIIAAGQFTEFTILFSPTSPGTYSANLQANSLSALLTASVLPAATLSTSSGALTAGATFDFGKLLEGTTTTQTFTLGNPATSAVTVLSIALSGAAFAGPTGISTPLILSPGQSLPFTISFTPPNSGLFTGSLTIDGRSFVLTGTGLQPPLPSAAIQLGAMANVSGQQSTVSIRLASASQVSGTGTLTMAFHPSLNGVADDPAIQFLSGPQRVATVTISPGDTFAKFDTATQLYFQTGTTAGTIVFTLTLPNATQQTSTTIAPAPISFDLANGTLLARAINVSLRGFDNTYSASVLTFTFYDPKGKPITPGTIRVDQTNNFQTYFASGKAGGMFSLLASFPISGDSTTVASADIQMTNSVGVSQTQHITF